MMALALLLAVPAGQPGAQEGDEEQTLTGVVTVHERDEQGAIRSLFLAGTEQGDLLVADNGLAEEMKDYVGETIEATGIIKKSEIEAFKLMIYVHDFYVVAPDEDEYYEDEDEEDPGSR